MRGPRLLFMLVLLIVVFVVLFGSYCTKSPTSPDVSKETLEKYIDAQLTTINPNPLPPPPDTTLKRP